MVDFQYFGDMPGITPYAEEARPDDENELATQLLQKYLDELFTRDDLPELRADRDQVDRLIARRPDLAEQTDQELVDYARSFLPLYRRLFCRHILTSGASGIGIGTVAGVLAAIDQPELIMTLVAGLGDVDSAAPSWSMWDMSRIVKGSPDLTATFDEGSSGLAARLEALAEAGNPSAEDFGKLFGSFIERFGRGARTSGSCGARPGGSISTRRSRRSTACGSHPTTSRPKRALICVSSSARPPPTSCAS